MRYSPFHVDHSWKHFRCSRMKFNQQPAPTSAAPWLWDISTQSWNHAWCPVCKSSQWNICPRCNLTACSNFCFFPLKEILKTLGISKCQASRSWLFLAAWLVWVPPSVPWCPMNGRWPAGHPRSSRPPGFCRACGTTVLETLSELGTADLITPSWSWKVSSVPPGTSGWWWYIHNILTGGLILIHQTPGASGEKGKTSVYSIF